MKLYGVYVDGVDYGLPYHDTSKQVCLIWAEYLRSLSFNTTRTITVRRVK